MQISIIYLGIYISAYLSSHLSQKYISLFDLEEPKSYPLKKPILIPT